LSRQILHVDLDAFFVSVEQALDPQLRGKPVVVGGDRASRGVVASASYEARVFGLRAGMPLTTARRLCPQAIFLRGSFQRYREASERFMSILASFTPDLEPAGIDEAYLDITGFEPLYGPVRQTALTIKRRVREELGLAASVGIASCKVVAKVASDLSKPDGLIEVAPGQECCFLAPLPVGCLPCVGPRAEQRLKQIGATTIGQLAALPVTFLKQAFGAMGQVMHRYANGLDERKVEPPAPAKSISRSTTLLEDTLDRRLLKAVLRYLSERVGAELRQEGKRARVVTLKLRYADFETITRSRTLTEAGSDQAIFEVGAELLERALLQRRERVRLIGIGVSGLVAPGRQLSLLDPEPGRRERLSQAIDRIRRKYGFTAIEVGQTRLLREVFRVEDGDYLLATPSLSR